MDRFIKASIIRAIRTVCQTAVAVIGTAFVLTDVHWGVVVSASLLAGILSILTSVATGLPEVDLAGWDDDETDEEYDTEDEEDAD